MVVLEPGTKFADRYRVQRLLGKGGMGAVYLAMDEKFGQRIALKVADTAGAPVFRERFEREARITAHLGRSPGFVRAVDWGELENSRLYLAMDLVENAEPLDIENGTLEEKLERLARATSIVAEAHKNGVIHRDLKPANFLQKVDGELLLSDFGLSKARSDVSAPELQTGEVTQTGASLGTPIYMAPEQFNDAKHADYPADVFSLGVILFRAITGRLPFEGKFTAIYLAQEEVRQGVRPAPRPSELVEDLSEDLDAICARAISVEAADRPTASELAEVLKGIASSGGAFYPQTLLQNPVKEEPKREPKREKKKATSGRRRRPSEDRGRARPPGQRSHIKSHIVSTGPADPIWFLRLRRYVRKLILIILILSPIPILGGLLLDVAGVQSHLPERGQRMTGEITVKAYAELPDETVQQLDIRAPELALRSEEPDWTTSAKVKLRIEVTDACLSKLEVNGEEVSFETGKWHTTVEHTLVLKELKTHELKLRAIDRAGNETELGHEVIRIDELVAEASFDEETSEVEGTLVQPLIKSIKVAKKSCPVDSDGNFTCELSEQELEENTDDDGRIPIEATSPRGDEVVFWLDQE